MVASSEVLVCPACKSEHVERVRARGLDHLEKLIGSQPFRCSDCGERFRSTASVRQGPGLEFPASETADAVCPNCDQGTAIRLTQGERDMADEDGWVVSCPECRALFPFIRPASDKAASG